jgi:hypothetical protein
VFKERLPVDDIDKRVVIKNKGMKEKVERDMSLFYRNDRS